MGEVIAKHLVNKAAGGDLKAIPLLLSETRSRENEAAGAGPVQVFDTPEDQAVLANMIARIRSSSPEGTPPTTVPQQNARKMVRRLHVAGFAGHNRAQPDGRTRRDAIDRVWYGRVDGINEDDPRPGPVGRAADEYAGAYPG